ncbi:MAG: DegT/DnrJ/EryC1/StrS family aminotransferase [candidate division Zixibacteria bacterium]|nr:DegT/DnrJ/EryC1/StrS family aminotransferase [candidate division Zixibacteria bacterium]
MAERRIPLFDLKLSPAAIREVNSVLISGWLTTGARVQAFERELAAVTGVRYVSAVSSATAGLFLTLEALGCGPGTEVITTPFTFVATAEAILRNGALPIFADIDPVTLNIDPDEVERKITDRTACVLVVDIGGYPCEYRRLREICDARKIPLVADASHSLGARYLRKTTAQQVDAAVYSFQATKNVTTAEGGAVISRHRILTDRVKLCSLHAMTRTAYQRRQEKHWQYDIVDLGYKGNLSDVHAAIGLGQLQGFAANQKKRQAIADRYRHGLAGIGDWVRSAKPVRGRIPAWHLYIVRLRLSRMGIDRDDVIRLMAESGVECGVHYRPLFDMSFYQTLGLSRQFFPNAAYAGDRVISLPMYPELRLRDVDYVCDRLRSIVMQYSR